MSGHVPLMVPDTKTDWLTVCRKVTLTSIEKSVSTTKIFSSSYLTSAEFDGAAVTLAQKSGATDFLVCTVPVASWSCQSPILNCTNRFRVFMVILCVIYHASLKSSRELDECANLLKIQVLRIRRICSTHWAASNFPSIFCVWENFEALVRHFKKAENDPIRDEKR
jgi:hypothetical protein